VTASRTALRIVRGAITVIALASFVLGLYSGTRWNELFLKAKPLPARLCQYHPAEFQVVEMKSPVCVPIATAVEWRANERLLKIAGGAFLGVLLIAAATQRAIEDEADSEPTWIPAGMVICTALFLFWGIWPAAIGTGLMGAAYLGKRLWSQRA
jgi:hypothetical protein